MRRDSPGVNSGADEEQSMQNEDAQERKADRRQFNNPHPAVEAAGVEAAEKGLPIYACPYKHPAMLAPG